MFTSGTMVRVAENGLYKPVEELRVGDLLFDPFADRYGEITDILGRRLDFSKIKKPRSHRLYPVTLRAGGRGPVQPNQDVMVSPSQEILSVRSDERRSTIKPLRRVNAKTLVASDPHGEWTVSKVQYFAIFTEFGQYVEVAGLLMRTFGPEVFTAERSEIAAHGQRGMISRALH